jgi:hypothetical protein
LFLVAVTSAVANTLEKWDFCYRKLKPNLLEAEAYDKKDDGEMFGRLNPCYSIEDLFDYEDTHLSKGSSTNDVTILGKEGVKYFV